MLVRQALPLLLAHSNEEDPIKGRTRFQKMLFMLQQEYKSCNFQYDFHPYDYGPYSSTLQSDIDELVSDDFLDEIRYKRPSGKVTYDYKITKKGKKIVNQILKSSQSKELELDKIYASCKKIKEFANSKNLNELLSYIYSKYPKYAKFSVFEF